MVKKFLSGIKEFWRDDRGALDEHTTKMVYAVVGIALTGIILTGAGMLIRNKAISFGQDVGSYKVNVNTTNAATQGNNVGYASGNTTVTTVNVQ